ncbi:hypothetical protein EV401DRAFT_1975766 [Pisolithus croceorrhizus]|nr:hypothetical protein EV401DRAFT_1975766 [Pisolithus croceorrhizus]
MIDYLLDGIKYLLEKLRSDSKEDNLRLMHTNATPVHRSVFIARICRMLCLASHNCPPHNLHCVRVKTRISHMITSLRRNNLGTSSFTMGLRIEQISYNQLDEIPARFASPLTSARSSLRVDAPAFVPRLATSSQPKPDHVAPPTSIGPARARVPARDVEGPLSDNDQAVAAMNEEESAARLIQRVYRLYRQKQKQWLERSTLEAERSAIFATCLKHAQTCGFARGFYRLLYLGPLPHLLLALKKGISIATFVKATTKIPGLLLREGHERLEELGRQRSEIS